MTIKFEISKNDVELVRQVCEQQRNHPIYLERINRNCSTQRFTLQKEAFWKKVFTCLLTTQQRSGDDSAINRFLRHGYTSIRLETLLNINNVERHIKNELKRFGGIRRNKKIAKEATSILNYFEWTEWQLLKEIRLHLNSKGNKQVERELANYIVEVEELMGLGPKQARNLLQMIGFTQYEIPIDSRITKWLNKNNIFQFRVNSKGLSDNSYYCILNDAIIALCAKAKIKPCLFDAAVFSLTN